MKQNLSWIKLFIGGWATLSQGGVRRLAIHFLESVCKSCAKTLPEERSRTRTRDRAGGIGNLWRKGFWKPTIPFDLTLTHNSSCACARHAIAPSIMMCQKPHQRETLLKMTVLLTVLFKTRLAEPIFHAGYRNKWGSGPANVQNNTAATTAWSRSDAACLRRPRLFVSRQPAALLRGEPARFGWPAYTSIYIRRLTCRRSANEFCLSTPVAALDVNGNTRNFGAILATCVRGTPWHNQPLRVKTPASRGTLKNDGTLDGIFQNQFTGT